jgi:NitT/TauT family transport system substrate-binding protein
MTRDARGDRVVDVTLAERVATYTRYTGWPELKESLISGKLKAAYMLAPMAMDLADKGVPVKVVALGHRSGAVIMVGSQSTARSIRDLRGQRVAIPSRFAVDHLFVLRLLKEHGMTARDVELIEMAPPEMPPALQARAVAAYATGEPFGSAAEVGGYGRPLYMTRDHWRRYICCVLTVREELIKEDRRLVQRIVDHVMSAGAWLEASRANREQAAGIAAGPAFFNQDPAVIRHALTQPLDRVTYSDLTPQRADFDEVMNLALEAGVISHPIPYETYVDESFVRNARTVPIDVRR